MLFNVCKLTVPTSSLAETTKNKYALVCYWCFFSKYSPSRIVHQPIVTGALLKKTTR